MALRNFSALLLGGVMSLAAASAGAAAYDWTLSGPANNLGGFAYDGSGTLTIGDVAGKIEITGITGEIGGSTVTGLTTFDGADNLFFGSSTLLDTSGLGVSTASGLSVKVFSFYAPNSTDITPGNNYGQIPSSGGFGVGTFSAAAAAVPEPGAWAMLIVGALGTGLALRRRAALANGQGSGRPAEA